MVKNEFFTFTKDKQNNLVVSYEQNRLGLIFQPFICQGDTSWAALPYVDHSWKKSVPKLLKDVTLGFSDENFAAYYLYSIWYSFHE